MILVRPFRAAMWMGGFLNLLGNVKMSCIDMCRSMDCIKCLTISKLPPIQALCRSKLPYSSCSRGLALCLSIKYWTIEKCPASAALWRGVVLCQPGSAWLQCRSSVRYLITSSFPNLAAVCRVVSLSLFFVKGSSPFAMRRLTSSRFPSLAASCRSELCSVVVSTETVFSCHVRRIQCVNFNFIMA